jgi:hypothetical protein
LQLKKAADEASTTSKGRKEGRIKVIVIVFESDSALFGTNGES